jgi:hypothetical protein
MLKRCSKLFSEAVPAQAVVKEVNYVKAFKDAPTGTINGDYSPKVTVHEQMFRHFQERDIIRAFYGLSEQPSGIQDYLLKKAKNLSEWNYIVSHKPIGKKTVKKVPTKPETLLRVFPDFFETFHRLRNGEIEMSEVGFETYLQMNEKTYREVLVKRANYVLDYCEKITPLAHTKVLAAQFK